MIHNFEKSLAHEREQTSKADKFYREVLHADNIVRFNSDSAIDMDFQHKDIDVQIEAHSICYNISEKFRDKHYNDLFIEIYSKYPNTLGWMHTGSPNAIVYFTPLTVYWITFKTLKQFCELYLFPSLQTTWFDEIYTSGKSRVKKTVTIENKEIEIQLIQAHNFDGSGWETIGVSISFEILARFGVNFKEYSYKAETNPELQP